MSDELLQAERALQAAMHTSDVAALERLLHPDVLAVLPDGRLVDRAADLEAHRAGIYAITELEEEELELRVAGEAGVTLVVLRLAGTIGGADASGRMRYTRMWTREDGSWRVLAAHISPLSRA